MCFALLSPLDRCSLSLSLSLSLLRHLPRLASSLTHPVCVARSLSFARIASSFLGLFELFSCYIARERAMPSPLEEFIGREGGSEHLARRRRARESAFPSQLDRSQRVRSLASLHYASSDTQVWFSLASIRSKLCKWNSSLLFSFLFFAFSLSLSLCFTFH